MEPVLLERRAGVAGITLNDPERRHALTLESSSPLAEAAGACERGPRARAVVVTGAAPGVFAGAGLSATGEAHEAGLRAISAGFLAVAGCALPTIAAVGGAAVGAGLNLALAADVRLAGPKARFVARFLELGLHPGGGMTWMLQRIVGPQVATAMTLFGQTQDAASAERSRLALRVVDGDHDALVAAAVELASPAVAAPRELVLATKRTMRVTAGLDDHATAIGTELVPQLESMATPAFTELLAVMREKISGQR